MMKLPNTANLTQHPASPEQKEGGVFDLEGEDLRNLKELLTFQRAPGVDEIERRAEDIACLAKARGPDKAMIGGAPYLMGALENALHRAGIEPVFAFSKRVVEEAVQPDGSVVKKAVFKHEAFVRVFGE